MSADQGEPRLSVVVTIVDGAAALHECLSALREQIRPPSLQVLVPYDSSVAGIDRLAQVFSEVTFLPMGSVATRRPVESPAGQHELYDRRRSVGLAAATGEIVCILEDRGIPEPEWAGKVSRLHERLPHAVIGGAVECGVDATLNWAVFFCDYSRYQLPFEAGPREWVTDVNISYKREALESVSDLWLDRYHETTVHWELARRGETLYLSPDFVVSQRRRELTVGSILRERIEWGRLFAYTRAKEGGPGRRAVLALLSPLLPLILLARHAKLQRRKGTHFGTFVRTSPLVALFLVAWSLGELLGYATGRP